MSASRRAGLVAVAVGLGLVVASRLFPGLGGPPLYDGVVPVGPYLWLAPGPGQQGGALGAKATVSVSGGQNDIVAVATPEMLPQAQVFAVPGSFRLPAGATSLSVSIEPVPPPGQPGDGMLASNVYRFELKDQQGGEVTAPASAKVSVVLRSADAALLTGVVERWDGSAWVPLNASPPGMGGSYLAVVTEFGDYAVVRPAAPAPDSGAPQSSAQPGGSAATGPAASAGVGSPQPSPTAATGSDAPSAGPDVVAPIAVAAVIAVVVFLALLLWGRRSGPPPPPPPLRGARRTPYRGAHRLDRD